MKQARRLPLLALDLALLFVLFGCAAPGPASVAVLRFPGPSAAVAKAVAPKAAASAPAAVAVAGSAGPETASVPAAVAAAPAPVAAPEPVSAYERLAQSDCLFGFKPAPAYVSSRRRSGADPFLDGWLARYAPPPPVAGLVVSANLVYAGPNRPTEDLQAAFRVAKAQESAALAGADVPETDSEAEGPEPGVPGAPASAGEAGLEPGTPAQPASNAAEGGFEPAGAAAAAPPPRPAAPAIPWKTETYSLVARSMDLRQVLETFGVAQGISTILSPAVGGALSGEFLDVPCGEFLDRLASLHNLAWYWDGATLWIYAASEMQTILLDLRYMKAGEVRAMLAELGVEDPRFPLKTASDDELIMVSGPPRYVGLVAEMIQKADVLRERRTFTEIETRIFPLQNTWADDVSFNAGSPESSGSIKGVASMLQQIVGKIASPGARESGTTNAPAAFQPLITAENRLNAVIVTDVSPRMPLYERLIKELDIPQKLVEIEVTVVELSRKDALDWQLSIAGVGGKDRISAGAGQNSGNLFDKDSLSGRGLAGALTYLGSRSTVQMSLSALRDKGKARNVSRTTLLTVNNLAAELSDQQTYHARVVGTEVAELAEVSAGTTLQIKPRIMRAGTADAPARIWLALSLQDGGFESVSVDSMPMSRSSTLDTQTSIYEDDTIVLAGYLRDIEESAGWGIPLLRDLPLVGWLFGGHSSKTETVQRLFLISPRVVDADADDLARLQAMRLRDIEVAEELQDDAGDMDEVRELRELDRQERRERRRDALDERLKERRRELERAREERARLRKEREAELRETEGRGGCLPW